MARILIVEDNPDLLLVLDQLLSVEHEVVVARAGHLEGVELEGTEPLDDFQDRCRLRRERAWWREQVPGDQEATGVVAVDRALCHRVDPSRGS